MENNFSSCELNTEVFNKVYIIESPSAEDLLEKRTEGNFGQMDDHRIGRVSIMVKRTACWKGSS